MSRTGFRCLYLFLFTSLSPLSAQTHYYSSLSSFSAPGWVQTNGPTGGFISTIQIDSGDSQLIYAVGPRDGIYKSIDGGASWRLVKFETPANERLQNLAVSPLSPSTLYCSSTNDLLKSEDAGETWHSIFDGFTECTSFARSLGLAARSNTLYVGTGVHFLEQCQTAGGTIYRTEDGGATWSDIGGNLDVPAHAIVETLALPGDGKIFAGINDQDLLTWHKGKVFYSENDGQSWSEVNYGASEDRFIWSIYANPFTEGEVWITE